MDINRSLVIKSFIWKLLERGGAQVVSFCVQIILARLLSPADYGLIALLIVFINLSQVVIEGGLNTALIQKKGTDDIDFSTIFISSMGISIFLYGLLFLFAPLIATFYQNPQLTPVIRVLSFSLLIYAYNSVQRAYVSKHMLFKKLFSASFIAMIIAGIVGIVCAYYGLGVWALVIYNLTIAFITMVVLRLGIKWHPVFQFSLERFKSLFDYGWKIFMTNFIIQLFVNIRSLIIGRIYAPSTLAFFDRGKQFPSLVMDNINSSMQQVLLPAFSEVQEDRERVKSMVRRSTKTSCFLMFPVLIGLCVISRPLILLLLTDKWEEAIPFMQIFCIAYMLMPVQIANMEAVKSLGYSGTFLKLEFIKKIVEVTILIITVFINAYAIAWGVVIYNFICLFINLYPTKKLLNYPIWDQLKDILPSLFVSILMGGVIFWLQYLPMHLFWIITLQIILGAIIYISFCHLFKFESYGYILSLFQKIIKR